MFIDFGTEANSLIERLAKAGDVTARNALMKRIRDAKQAGREWEQSGSSYDAANDWLIHESGWTVTERRAFRHAWWQSHDERTFEGADIS